MADYNYDESKRTEKMAKKISEEALKLRIDKPQYDPEMQYVKGDPVRDPNHYTKGEVECIDAMKAAMSPEAFCGFCKGNVLKYIWRYETKGAGLQDLQKAQVYLGWLIDMYGSQEQEVNEWLNEVRGGQ